MELLSHKLMQVNAKPTQGTEVGGQMTCTDLGFHLTKQCNTFLDQISKNSSTFSAKHFGVSFFFAQATDFPHLFNLTCSLAACVRGSTASLILSSAYSAQVEQEQRHMLKSIS